MQQLSTVDAAFLSLETQQSPMHIGALYIFTAPDKKSASFEMFKKRVEERLHLAAVLRQKLVHVPFNLVAPYLVDDPAFALSSHLTHIGLPNPGQRETLNTLAAQILRKPLDKQKALWELTFIDHIENIDLAGRHCFAVISKVHQSIAQSMDGDELVAKLLDFSPEPNHRISKQAYRRVQVPSPIHLFVKSYGPVLSTPTKMIQTLAKATSAGAQLLARKSIANLQKLTTASHAPTTPFERELSDDRVFATLKLSLHDIKRCRGLCEDATIHDVILGILASGLREYLSQTNALPEHPLIALVPISFRATNQLSQPQQSTDQSSARLIQLAMSPMTTLEHIQDIQQKTAPIKTTSKRRQLSHLAEFLPNICLSMATKLYTSWYMSNHHKPLFNLVITHVPGPQIPLYLGKAKLQEQYDNAPIFHGMGLSIVIASYNGHIGISINSCQHVLAHPDKLINAIDNSFDQLRILSKQQRGLSGKIKTKKSQQRHHASVLTDNT